MREIKMIVCDVDGTLLNKEGTVLKSTLDIIDRCRAKGLLFGLATGRDADSVERFYKKWGIEGKIDFFVCSNGAHLKDDQLKLDKQSHYIEVSTLKDLIHHFEDLPVNFAISEKGFFFMAKEDEIVEILSQVEDIPIKVIDYELYLNEPKAKLHIVCIEENMPLLIERAKTFKNPLVYGGSNSA